MCENLFGTLPLDTPRSRIAKCIDRPACPADCSELTHASAVSAGLCDSCLNRYWSADRVRYTLQVWRRARVGLHPCVSGKFRKSWLVCLVRRDVIHFGRGQGIADCTLIGRRNQTTVTERRMITSWAKLELWQYLDPPARSGPRRVDPCHSMPSRWQSYLILSENNQFGEIACCLHQPTRSYLDTFPLFLALHPLLG